VNAAGTITVRCANDRCPGQADTTVTFTEAAPGVLAVPALLCAGCGDILQVMP
jgi:hypothetical protein